jgi:predicted ATPase
VAVSEPFVGRETQVGALVAAVAAAEVGHGSVAFVGGEAGIGKTRLVTEVAARIACPVLWARCWQGDGAPAFWPWQQLVRAVLAGDGPTGRHVPVRADTEALGRLLGEAQTVDVSEGARFRLFDAVVDLFAAAAEPRPLVLVIDDLHWADEPSLRLLQFVGRDPRARRLAVIGTYRNTDLDARHPLMRCFADLAESGPHVFLGGLGKRDVTALAGALEPAKALTAGAMGQLHRRTGGNPLFVRELLRSLDEQGRAGRPGGGSASPVPSSVRAVVAQRLAGLPPWTQEVLRAAAVIGEEFDVGTLAWLVDGTLDDVSAALEDAVSAGLVHRTGDGAGFGFVHAVMREVLYDELAHAVRTGLHRRVAARLEETGGQHLVPQLAHHLLRAAVDAVDRTRAVEYAVRAGRHDAGLLAYEDAAHWFARALDVLGDDDPDGARQIDLHLALGEASLAAGDLARARDAYLRLRRLRGPFARCGADRAARAGARGTRPRAVGAARLGAGPAVGRSVVHGRGVPPSAAQRGSGRDGAAGG